MTEKGGEKSSSSTKSRLLDKFTEFQSSYTGLQGFSNAGKLKKNPVRSLMWYGLFIVGLYFTVENVYRIFCDFHSYPYMTKTTKNYQRGLAFPSVTFCPSAPFRCVAMAKIMAHPQANVGFLEGFIQVACEPAHLAQEWTCPRLLQAHQEVAAKVETLDPENEASRVRAMHFIRVLVEKTMVINNCTHDDDDVDFLFLANLDNETLIIQQLSLDNIRKAREGLEVALPQLFPIAKAMQMSVTDYDISIFILSCTYGRFSQPCDLERDFTRFRDNDYGQCWTFSPSHAATAGVQSGLTVILNIKRSSYPPLSSDSSGAVVMVHDAGSAASPMTNSILLEPVKHHQIFIAKRVEKTLPDPYETNCTRGWGEYTPFRKMLDLPPPLPRNIVSEYQVADCNSICEAIYIMKKCGCRHPFYRSAFETDEGIEPEDYQSCMIVRLTGHETGNTFFRKDQSKCVNEVFENMTSGLLTCPCNVPCEKTVYSTKHSSFAWFDSRIRDYLAYDGVKLTREEGERDVLRVQVGFESLEVETIEQVPIYVDYKAVLGEIGGGISLFLGLCLVTVVEIVELAVILLYEIIFPAGRTSQVDDPQERREGRKTWKERKQLKVVIPPIMRFPAVHTISDTK